VPPLTELGTHLTHELNSILHGIILRSRRVQLVKSTQPSIYGLHQFSSMAAPHHGVPPRTYMTQSTRCNLVTLPGNPSPFDTKDHFQPKWMTQTYELCVCNTHQVLHHQFLTLDLKDKINLILYWQFNKTGKRVFTNLMSGKWAWKQAVSHLCSVRSSSN
jgi:hypothetical protein